MLNSYLFIQKNKHKKKVFFFHIYLKIGKAKNLVQMWKTIDKENTPPPERRGPRAFTPPIENERRLSVADDVKVTIYIFDVFIFK